MIEVTTLTRYFGDYCAVNALSFSIKAGEIVGLLGPNGAGKSTTMKMLTGFLLPSRGKITISGMDVVNNSFIVQKRMGYLAEGAPAYNDLTVQQFLNFIADVRLLKGNKRKQAFEEVITLNGLQMVLKKRIYQLSKGYKRRVGLAQAMIHQPKLLILDEPTDGLDPNQKHEVRLLIKRLAADKTVLISTHILEEVQAICSRVLIMHQGQLVKDSTPRDLVRQSRYFGAIVIHFEQLPNSNQKAALQSIGTIDHVEWAEQGYLAYVFFSTNTNHLALVEKCVGEHDMQVSSIHVDSGRLEDVFRRLTIGEAS